MTPEERDRLADQWLRMALRRHGAAEPRPGLESRILAAIAAEKSVSRAPSQWLRIALPVAAATVLAIGIGFGLRTGHRKAPVPVAGPSEAQVAVSVPFGAAKPEHASATSFDQDAVGEAPTSKSAERRVRNSDGQQSQAAASPSPRLEQFPAPRPLSEQERLLLVYLHRTPEEEVRLVAQRQAEERKRTKELIEGQPGTPGLDGHKEER